MQKKSKPQPQLNIVVATKFRNVLIEMGYAGKQLDFLMAQAAHETNGFNHEHALDNNNFAGIKYVPLLHKVATPATNFPVPKKEGGGYYARFSDPLLEFTCRAWIIKH